MISLELRKIVCGVNSLIIYEDVEIEKDNNGEIYRVSYHHNVFVRCECCSFAVWSIDDIENASEYGIEGIEDYWV